MLHCAFKGCTWTHDIPDLKDSGFRHWGQEWILFCHLLIDHEAAFEEEFVLCRITDRTRWSNMAAVCPRRSKTDGEKWQDDLFLHVISNYMKAMTIRLEEGMPDVGPCVDRRALRGLNTIMARHVRANPQHFSKSRLFVILRCAKHISSHAGFESGN